MSGNKVALKGDWSSAEGQFAHLGQVEFLNGNNFRKWKGQVEFYLGMHNNMDYCLFHDKPEEAVTEESSEDYKWHHGEWFRTNRLAKNVIRNTMSEIVRGSIEEPEDAVEYLEAISEKFIASERAEAARLSKEFHELKFDGNGSVREHILHKVHLNAKLRELRMGITDNQLIHEVLDSLPNTYSHLRTTYNASDIKWTINKLISICVDEENRIKKEAGPTTAVNLVEKAKKKKNKFKAIQTTDFKNKGEPKPKPVKGFKPEKGFSGVKFNCFFCKKGGHMKKDCPGWKAWMIKKGYHKEEDSKNK